MPINPPIANIPGPAGRVRVGLGLRSRNIWVAEKPTNSAKSTLSTLPGMATAIWAPSADPTRMPGASRRATGHNTAPRW